MEKVTKWANNVQFKGHKDDHYRVITCTKKDFEVISEKLSECKIEHYSYTPKSEKQKYLVLKESMAVNLQLKKS